MQKLSRNFLYTAGFIITTAMLGFQSFLYDYGIDETKNRYPQISNIIQFLHEWSWVTAIILSIGSSFFLWALKNDYRNRVQSNIKKILDKYHKVFFNEVDPDDENRVSILVYNQFNFKWKVLRPLYWWNSILPNHGWLCLYARSGDNSQQSNTTFPCSKENSLHKDKAGVAGKSFIERKFYKSKKLPRYSKKFGDKERNKFCETYAEDTFVSKRYVMKRIKKGLNLPTRIIASPIEVNGTKWGVAVIDSSRNFIKVNNSESEAEKECRELALEAAATLSVISKD